jgi:hypothetical protein
VSNTLIGVQVPASAPAMYKYQSFSGAEYPGYSIAFCHLISI